MNFFQQRAPLPSGMRTAGPAGASGEHLLVFVLQPGVVELW
jgi:hypothetical protein